MKTKPGPTTPDEAGGRDVEKTSPDGFAVRSFEEESSAMPLVKKSSVPSSSAKEARGFDPYRFQANTMPPGFRAELAAVTLPVVPAEELQDTPPPRAGGEPVLAPPERSTAAPEPRSVVVEAPPPPTEPALRLQSAPEPTLEDSLSSMDTSPSLRTRGRGARRLVLWSSAVVTFGILIAVYVLRSGNNRQEPSAPLPSLAAPQDVLGTPQERPSSQTPPPGASVEKAAPVQLEALTPVSTGNAVLQAPSHKEPKRRPQEPAIRRETAAPDPGLELPAIAEPSPPPVTPVGSSTASTNPLDKLIVPPGQE